VLFCPQGHGIYVDGGRKNDADIPCPVCELSRLRKVEEAAREVGRKLGGSPDYLDAMGRLRDSLTTQPEEEE
jgi:hypothetical protein